MQQSGDGALATAVASADRVVVHQFLVDWDRDGSYDHALSDLTSVVADVRLDRHLQGALPQETTIVEGYASTDLVVVIEGKMSPSAEAVARLLSPWNQASPLYGVGRPMIPCKWDLTVRKADGTVTLLRQFTGSIVDCKVQHTDDGMRAELIARDGSETLRAPITLPIVGLPDYSTQQLPTLDYRTNSHAVIDHVLRKNGVYQSPPPQLGCIFSCPAHGGMIPDVGYSATIMPFISIGSCGQTDPVTTEGLYGLAYTGSMSYVPTWSMYAEGSFLATPGNKYAAQFLAKYGPTPSFNDSTPGYILEVCSSQIPVGTGPTMSIGVGQTSGFGLPAGRIWVTFWNFPTTITVNGPAAVSTDTWHNVKVGVTFGSPLSNSSVTVDVDGVTATTTGVDLSFLSPSYLPDRPNASVWVHAPVPVQCVQVCQVASTYSDHWYGSHTSECDIDPGLNEFLTLPAAQGVDSWSLLKQVAEAEFGVIGHDENNRFFFRNRETVRAQSLTIEKTITATDSLRGLSLSERADGVRNTIPLVTTQRWLSRDYVTRVFELGGIDDIACPNGVTDIVLRLREPAIVYYQDPIAVASTAAWDLNDAVAGTFLPNNPATNTDVASGVTVATFALKDLNTVRVQVTNTNAFPIRFSTNDNRPAFRLAGSRVFDESTVTVTSVERQSSIDRYGERVLSLGSNPFRQRPQMLEQVARQLLKDLKAPVPVLDRISVVGDPRLQLGDTVEITDSGGLGGPFPATVTSITRRLSDGKLTDELVVRPFAAAGKWILGHATYSTLASTTILG